jgi:hypothetical protein
MDGYKIIYRRINEDILNDGCEYSENGYFPKEEYKWKRLDSEIKPQVNTIY